MKTAKVELSLELETVIPKAVVDKARSLRIQVNIALVEEGPNLKGFIPTDGALLGAIDVPIKQACTTPLFEMESGSVGELSEPGGPLYNIEHSNGGFTFNGPVPIKSPSG